MAAPVEIAVASEGKAFRMGIQNDVIKPLEDAETAIKNLAKPADKTSDTLDDMGRNGKKAGDRIETALEDAQKESDRTRRELEDLGDAMTRAGRKGADIEEGMRKGTDGAGEAVAEFKDEAVANLSETVSSFRGDAEDIAQIAQDTLGGVVGNLGPVGMAAGVAGAAGIGLIMGAIEEAKAKEQEFREQVAELAQVLMDTGDGGSEAIAAIAEKLRELAAPTDEGVESLAKLKEQAENSESGFKKLAQAYAGNADGLEKIIKKEREALDAMDNRSSRRSKSTRAEIGDRREIVASLEEQKKVIDEAAKAEEAWIAAGGPALEARASQLDTIQGELDESVGAWSEYVNAETGAIDPAAYIAAMQARMDATASFSGNVELIAEKFGLSFEESQAILDQGVDFAPMLQSIIDNGLDAEFAAKIQAAVGGGQEILDGNPLGTTVTADADVSGAEGSLQETAKDRTSGVTAVPDTKQAGGALDALVSKKRTATIGATASTGSASGALDRAARDRTAQITAVAQTWLAEQSLDRLTRPRTVHITADVRDREGRPA